MTLDNRLDWDGDVYGSVKETETELMLQPYASRRKVMSSAWMGMLGFLLLVLPFTILPTFLVTLFGLILLSAISPGLQNSWFAVSAILLLWGAAFALIGFLIWQAIADSGYKIILFDRVQKQLIINTATIIGRKVVTTIPFTQIRDAQLDERDDDGILISVFLTLDDWEFLGLTYPRKISLSSFGCVSSEKTVKNLTASKHHQKLLLAVRNILEFSTYDIAAQLRRNPVIPTELELERQKAQAVADATASLKNIVKLTFSSQASKSAELESLRTKTLTQREDPQVWEQFALVLSLQKNAPKAEIVSAYRRAESLYLDRDDIARATAISELLKRMG
jgi:hypothetical protein